MIDYIASGKYKNHRLKTLDGKQTRPTLSRLRKSLCDIITHSDILPPLNTSICADIFAGSGAVGIALLSHGAQKVYFCENYKNAFHILQENTHHIDHAIIYQQSAFDIKMVEKCDIVFIDPPYDFYDDDAWLTRLCQKWCHEGSYIILQSPKSYQPSPNIYQNNLSLLMRREYGKHAFIFLKYER